MGYLRDSWERRRVRSKRRAYRLGEEYIKKKRLYLCLGAVGVIIITLTAWCVIGQDDKNKDGVSSVNATITSHKTSFNDKESTTEISKEEETTAPKVYAYGDDLCVDNQLIVCIDAGHGGNDTGCEGNDGTTEKDDDLKLAIALKYQLEAMGVKVVMTRSTDEWLELSDRAHIANVSNADAFISIHRNSLDEGSAKGVEAWVNSVDSDNSYELATLIMEKLEKVGISRNRGVKKGSMGSSEKNYTINEKSSMPSVLLEMGFISSLTDNRLLKENLADYAKGIAEAIIQWSQSKAY